MSDLLLNLLDSVEGNCYVGESKEKELAAEIRSLLSQEAENADFLRAVANACQDAETKVIQLTEENRLLQMEVDNLQNSVKESAASAVPALELSRLREIANLIGCIFVYGDFKAETFNERKLEALLREQGTFYESVAEYEKTFLEAAPTIPTTKPLDEES